MLVPVQTSLRNIPTKVLLELVYVGLMWGVIIWAPDFALLRYHCSTGFGWEMWVWRDRTYALIGHKESQFQPGLASFREIIRALLTV